MAKRINAAGGVAGKKLEIVPMDNKLSPQDSVGQAQKAIDKGIRSITQGNSSGIAAGVNHFVNKHKKRNQGQGRLYINYQEVAPSITKEHCGYWHFRRDNQTNQ